MSININGTSKGNCPLCLKDKEMKLFVIQNPGYPGMVCGDHLYVLAEQLNTKAKKEPKENGKEDTPLFEGAK